MSQRSAHLNKESSVIQQHFDLPDYHPTKHHWDVKEQKIFHYERAAEKMKVLAR